MNLKITLTVAFIAFAAHVIFADENAPTVRLPLPAQLSGGTLPYFGIRDRNGQRRIEEWQLKRMIEPQTRRVALIYFATWCVPCAQGAQRLANASDELKLNGVQPIFINIGERDNGAIDTATISAWVDKYAGSNFARLIDAQIHMTEQFGLTSGPNGQVITPKTLVLDRDLKPLFLLGEEGNDYPDILWKYNP